MILHIITTTGQQQTRDFSCYFEELERAYEFLLTVKNEGDQFLEVEFIHKGSYYSISVEELNQGPAVNPFYQLRQQYEQCLAQPLSGQEAVTRLHERLIDSQQAYLINLRQTLAQMMALLEESQLYLTDGPRKAKLIQQYWLTIARCHRSLAHHTVPSWGVRSRQAV